MKKNTFSKALKHLKSTELDEKIQRLNEAPTNSMSGVYALNPPGFRVGIPDPPEIYYPDVDGNWPAGIPGTPGELSYTRPEGYWSGGSDWDQQLTTDFSQNYLLEDPTGKSTSGLIANNGTVFAKLPPGGQGFILGPIVDGFVPNHTSDAFTNIGYIQKDTRQFVLLARIQGQWKSNLNGNFPVWDGTEGKLTIYNASFTLAMAEWIRNEIISNKFVSNVPYFYSGGVPQVPQSAANCPNCPPGMYGGNGVGGQPYGQGGNPNIGTKQGDPTKGGPGNANLWGYNNKTGKKEKLSAKDYAAYKAGGGDAAAKKGKSIKDIIAQGKKNLGQYDSGPKPKPKPTPKPKPKPPAGGGMGGARGSGSSPGGVKSGGTSKPKPKPPAGGGMGGKRGSGSSPGGVGAADKKGNQKPPAGGGMGGARGGSQKNSTREVVKPSKKGGLPVKTIYRGMPEKSADLTRKFGTKETGTTMGRKGVSVSSKPEVARSYADENPLTRGTPVGNKTGEVWKGRIPANAGSSFRGVTVVSKQVADTAFKNNLNKEAQPPKRSGARPKAGTTFKISGIPGGGSASAGVQPIEPWVSKTDPLQGYTWDPKNNKYKLANSNEPQGELISESRQRILREIKQPLKIEDPQPQKLKNYRPNFAGKYTAQNTPDVTASPKSDDMVKAQNAAGQTWRTNDKYWKGYETVERMNIIYDNVGHGSQYWDMIVNENHRKKGERDREVQEHLNIIAHEKAMLREDPLYESPFKKPIQEQETLQADKDPLFKKVKDKLKPVIDYPDKPSKLGYPDEPPPEMVNGMHPQYGERDNYYNRLDPHSANSMPSTGNPKIDAKVRRAKTLKKVLGKKA